MILLWRRRPCENWTERVLKMLQMEEGAREKQEWRSRSRTERGSRFSPGASEEAQPRQSPWLPLNETSGLWNFKRVICVVLSHPVGGNLLPQQLGTNVPSTGAVQCLRSHQRVGHGLFLRMRKNFPEAPGQTSSYLFGQTVSHGLL